MKGKVLALLALCAGACSSADLIAPGPAAMVGSEASASARSDVKLVPIKADLYGYSFALGNGVAVGCPVGYNRTGLDLAGDVSHLGASTLASVHCNRTLSANPLVIDANGAGAMIAANGDELAFTYTLTSAAILVGAVPPTVDFDIAVTFAGGTGRFGNASGGAVLACRRTSPSPATLPPHIPPYANIYDCSLDGMVSSVGSSK